MSTPSVSIVIPTRDRPAFLTQAVRSALSQLDVDVEVVVVDDGSEVPAGRILEDLSQDRLTVIRNNSSRGVAAARNVGIAAAQATWISFLDDDDLLAPGAVAAHLDALEHRREAGWSCVGMIEFAGKGHLLSHSPPPDPRTIGSDLLWRNAVAGPSAVVVARDVLNDAQGFDPAFSCFADWDLWIRVASRSRLATVDRPLAGCRSHPRRMSLDPEVWDRELLLLRAKHGTPADAPTAARLASWGRADALAALAAGHARRATRELCAVGRRDRDWRAATYAAAIAVSPRAVGAAVAGRAKRRIPSQWRREAGDWLPGASAG